MFYHRNPNEGLVEVICGSMFSGKTEELLRRIRRAQIARQPVQLFKPEIDTRFGTKAVKSHDLRQLEAVSIRHSSELLEKIHPETRVVGIDEVQFLDAEICEVVEKLAFTKRRMILAGLDLDAFGAPFGPMPTLLSIAEHVTKLAAVCVCCGGDATRSQRLIPEGQRATQKDRERFLLGAQDRYEARCRFCHDPRPFQECEAVQAKGATVETKTVEIQAQ